MVDVVLMKEAANELNQAFSAINIVDGDRKRVCKFSHASLGRIRRRQYKSAAAWMAEAKRELKPKAVDWDEILAFLQGLMPLIEQLIKMFTKTV